MENKTAVKQAASFALELGARIILGGYFIFYALPKLKDPRLFALNIGDYQLVSDPIPTMMSVGLPWLELLVGVAVIVRRLYVGSLTVLVGMLAMFIVALISVLARNMDIECGCGGGRSIGEQLIHDIVLVAIAGTLLFRELRQRPS